MTYDPVDANDDGTVEADVNNQLVETGRGNIATASETVTIRKEADDTIVVVDNDDLTITETTDFPTALNTADDALSRGGDIVLRVPDPDATNRYYDWDSSSGGTLDTFGARIRGEGSPWEGNGGAGGPEIRASASPNILLNLTAQFQRLDSILLNGYDNATATLRMSRLDQDVVQCGIKGGVNYNIEFFGGLNQSVRHSFVEFSDFVEFRTFGDTRYLHLHDNIFAAASGAQYLFEITGSSPVVEAVHMSANKVIGYDVGINTNGAIFRDSHINDAAWYAIGRANGSRTPEDVVLYNDGGSVINTTIETPINGDDPTDGTVQTHTDHVYEAVNSGTAQNLQIDISQTDNISGDEIVDGGDPGVIPTWGGIEIRESDPSAGPAAGVRMFYRRDLATPELRAINPAGTVATLVSF